MVVSNTIAPRRSLRALFSHWWKSSAYLFRSLVTPLWDLFESESLEIRSLSRGTFLGLHS
jgi:hypothetical protein